MPSCCLQSNVFATYQLLPGVDVWMSAEVHDAGRSSMEAESEVWAT